LSPTITPVYSFRIILAIYFPADLALLPDRNYVFPNLQHVYDLQDVTAEVASAVRTSISCPTPNP